MTSDEDRVELTVEHERERRLLRILVSVLKSGPTVRCSLTNLLDSLFEAAEEDHSCRSTTPTRS